jgi:hypothetical protein
MEKYIFDGVEYDTLAEACRAADVNYYLVSKRLARGWDLATAISTPEPTKTPRVSKGVTTPIQMGSDKRCAVTGLSNPRRSGWFELGGFRLYGKYQEVWERLTDPMVRDSLRRVLDVLDAQD